MKEITAISIDESSCREPKNLERNKIPIKKNLKNFSLYQVLAYLNEQKKTGILTVEDGDVKKGVFIEDGDVIFASSNKEEDRLGRMLVKSGKITSEQAAESLRLMRQTGKRQGISLVELGHITPKDLFCELTNHVKAIIFSLFLIEEGTFSFLKITPSPEFVKLKINMESLICEGMDKKKVKKREKDNLFIQKVNYLYEKISSLSYYDILEVDMKASHDEIEKAYLKMSKHYYPDKHHDLPDSSVKGKLIVISNFINMGYLKLSNKIKRSIYDTDLLRKAMETSEDYITKAYEQFKKGVKETGKGNFGDAIQFFHRAIRANPMNAKYWAHLSLTLSKTVRRGKEAERAILQAIELEPYNAGYHLHLGKIYSKVNMKKKAVCQFKNILTWDPTNKKAQKELDKLREKRR
ncbi:MAG: DUF4388 domain-containing protein [Candidatus Mariimomonas ferrooxydans]